VAFISDVTIGAQIAAGLGTASPHLRLIMTSRKGRMCCAASAMNSSRTS
jgi:hypothetical protein